MVNSYSDALHVIMQPKYSSVKKTSPLDTMLSQFNPSSCVTFLSTNLLQGHPQVLQNIHEAVHLVSRCKVKHPVSTALVHFPAGKLLQKQKPVD
jgi:hypothetical protein